MIQLSPEQIQITKDILAQYAPGKPACAFGSRVQGTARATSDLDLLILGSEALVPEHRAELKLAFSKSNLPFFVDIVEQARISSQFFEQISKQTEPLTNGIARFAGRWSIQEQREFSAATQSFREIEPDTWK
jgi:predicted nucleotidyltransferase